MFLNKHFAYEKCVYQILKLFIIQNMRHISEKKLPGVFCKKGVLKNFAKLTGKHLCQVC